MSLPTLLLPTLPQEDLCIPSQLSLLREQQLTAGLMWSLPPCWVLCLECWGLCVAAHCPPGTPDRPLWP